MNAIVLRSVVKHFRKQTIRRQHTTFKTELINWLLRRKERENPSVSIQALNGIDLDIPKGKTVGLIGRNGSGKSTMLKLITGIYGPTSGKIEVHGRISALLDLGAGFHPEFSGRENILINGIILGMSRSEVKARTQQIIDFAELGDFIDEPVRTYSSGMYMRLAFSVATHVDPDILLIDEILAVGDEHFSKKSRAKMDEFKSSGRTIVLVTHDLGTIERWCDLAAWIDGGRIRQVGDPKVVAEQYRKAIAAAEAQAVATGSSALSAPGGALPEVKAPEGPKGGVEICAVRLLGGDGKPRAEVDTEEPLEICIDFVAKEPLDDLGFSVELRRPDGLSVYWTSTTAEGVRLPNPVRGAGTVKLALERVGLLKGTYELAVVAHGPDSAVHAERRWVDKLAVRSSGRDSGIARPPHRWHVELAGPEREARPAKVG